MSSNNRDTIYALRHKATGLIKIGSTNDWDKRISALGCKGQDDDICETLGMEYVRNPSRKVHQLEKAMHRKLKQWRIPGTEWFFCDHETFSDVWGWGETQMGAIAAEQGGIN